MELRNYQARTLKEVSEALTQHSSVLVAAPTGAGKGTMAVEIARECISKGLKVLFLVHRREIVEDYIERCAKRGLTTGAVMGGRPVGKVRPSTAMTVQSLAWGRQDPNSKRYIPDADVVILDECHHYVSDAWSFVADIYPSAKLIGLTATPWRGDGRSLGDMFEKVIVSAHYSALIADGMIVPCQVLAPDHHLGQDIAQDPVEAYKQHGVGSTLVFFSNKTEASSELERFRNAGIQAEMVVEDTTTGRRNKIFKAFKSGHLKVLINVYVASEGMDFPRCQTIILARTCGHMGTYLQIVGRALRTFPGKGWARLIDLTGASHVHGLPTQDRDYSVRGTVMVQATAGVGAGAGAQPAPVQILGIPLQCYGFEVESDSATDLAVTLDVEPKDVAQAHAAHIVFNKARNLWQARQPRSGASLGYYKTEEEASGAVEAWKTANPGWDVKLVDDSMSRLRKFLRTQDLTLNQQDMRALCRAAGFLESDQEISIAHASIKADRKRSIKGKISRGEEVTAEEKAFLVPPVREVNPTSQYLRTLDLLSLSNKEVDKLLDAKGLTAYANQIVMIRGEQKKARKKSAV